MTLPEGVERVLYTEEQVAARVGEIAAEISSKVSGARIEADRGAQRLGVFPHRVGPRAERPR